MKNYEIRDEKGKKREIRKELFDFVGQTVEFEANLTKAYEDTHKLLMRDVKLLNGKKVANHCNMMIKANTRNDKGRQKEAKIFNEIKKFENKRIKFVGEVREYEKNGIKNVGISKFVRLIED